MKPICCTEVAPSNRLNGDGQEIRRGTDKPPAGAQHRGGRSLEGGGRSLEGIRKEERVGRIFKRPSGSRLSDASRNAWISIDYFYPRPFHHYDHLPDLALVSKCVRSFPVHIFDLRSSGSGLRQLFHGLTLACYGHLSLVTACRVWVQLCSGWFNDCQTQDKPEKVGGKLGPGVPPVMIQVFALRFLELWLTAGTELRRITWPISQSLLPVFHARVRLEFIPPSLAVRMFTRAAVSKTVGKKIMSKAMSFTRAEFASLHLATCSHGDSFFVDANWGGYGRMATVNGCYEDSGLTKHDLPEYFLAGGEKDAKSSMVYSSDLFGSPVSKGVINTSCNLGVLRL